MKIPTFVEQQQAWSSPPVDDIGYLPSSALLEMSDDNLRKLINQMAINRYTGWRNYLDAWVRVLGLSRTENKRVLDYGCGVGLEALTYARLGNTVSLADIVRDNVLLARKVLNINGFDADEALTIRAVPPFAEPTGKYDIIHCCGVLHHIPNPIPVVYEMSKWVVKNGELRLMLYSDEAWRIATGKEPPDSVIGDRFFERYVRYWDAVGNFADWYDERRLRDRFGDWFKLATYEPLTENGAYIGAVLVRR